jgi:hypothetical protein
MVELAILVELKLFLRIPPVLLGGVILAFADAALERNQFNSSFLGSHTLSPYTRP